MQLPPIFTYADAKALGISDRDLYFVRDRGAIVNLTRGVYRRCDHLERNEELFPICLRAPLATLCLTSALSIHQLCDVQSPLTDVALPRGWYRPKIGWVAWHSFDLKTFRVGREMRRLNGKTKIGIYGPERSILDAIRMRHREGPTLGYNALKLWVDREGNSPGRLLNLADAHFPQVAKALRGALDVIY